MEYSAFPLTFIYELGRLLSVFERARLRNVCTKWNEIFIGCPPNMDFKAALFEANRVTFNEATTYHNFRYYRFALDSSATDWKSDLIINQPEALEYFIRGIRSISNIFIQTDHIQFKSNPINLLSFVRQRSWNVETVDIWMGNSLNPKTLSELIAPFTGAVKKLNVLYLSRFVAPTSPGKLNDYKQLAAIINRAVRLQRLRLPAHYLSDHAHLPIAQSDLHSITMNVVYIPTNRTIADVCFPRGLLDILPRNLAKLEIDVGSRAFLIREENEENEIIDSIDNRLQKIFYAHREQAPHHIDIHLYSNFPTTHKRILKDALLDTTVKVIIRSFNS